jgi:hypothetical protein
MGKRRGLGGRFLQGLLVYLIAKMMSNPSIKPAIDVLISQMALTVYALNGRKSMGLATASVAKSVPSGGCEDT